MSRAIAIDQAREKLGVIENGSALLLNELALARARLGDAGSADPAVRNPLVQAEREAFASFADARRQARIAADAVDNAIGKWLSARPTFASEVDELETATPVVLVPVRLEVRFLPVGSPKELVVRVYPDAIAADAHEPGLTPVEREVGEGYWSAAGDAAARRAAWAAMLVRMSPERAAWVVSALEPSRVGPPDERPTRWTRPVLARALPERWLVQACRGGKVVHQALGSLVPRRLALSPDPVDDRVTKPFDLSGDGLTLDDGMVWTQDLARAETSGMVVRLGPLTATDLAQGFDRIVAIGVRAHDTALEGAAELAGMIRAHRYTHGVGFMRAGTPTNNTEEGRSGGAIADPHGADALGRHAVTQVPGVASNGRRATDALGITGAIGADLGRWEGAHEDPDAVVRLVHDAIFPVLLGYPVEQFAPAADRAAIDALRAFFVQHVRPGGHIPILRVGEVPYGMLLVSDLGRWKPASGSVGPTAYLPNALRALAPSWQAAVPGVPRIGGTQDASGDLIKALQTMASSEQVRVRSVWGPDLAMNLVTYFGAPSEPPDFGAWQQRRADLAEAHRDLLTQAAWDPARLPWRLLGSVPRGGSFDFRNALVHDALSEETPLPAEPQLRLAGQVANASYPQWLSRATVDELRGQQLERPALLFLLLRQALLLEYRGLGLDLLIDAGLLPPEARREPELVGIELADGTTHRGLWEILSTALPSAGGATLLEYLHKGHQPETSSLDAYRERLQALGKAPTMMLHRVTGEALDVTAHRLDAWIEALVGERLELLRKTSPEGSHVGGYGWLVDVRPAASAASAGGFVHAPSTDHAVTAAVLRSGFINRSLETPRHFAINLSSARVRAAVELLDGVRAGQELGALLGYRFEQALDDEARQGHEARRHVAGLRAAHPLVDGKLTPAPVARQGIPARDVVDGLALWRAAAPFASLTQTTAEESAALARARTVMGQTLDAVADLLMAESVHHLTGGRHDAAGASLDALATGARPPEPSVARTPRRGTEVVARAVVLLDPEASQAPWWPASPTPRARAAPVLDAWLGPLFGDPRSISCSVTWPVPANATPVVVTLAQLGLSPVDLVAIVSDASGGGASELDLRILVAAGAPWSVRTWSSAVIDLTAAGVAGNESFADVLELVRLAQQVVAGVRSVEARDLLHPSVVAKGSRPSADLETRAADAIAGVKAAKATLQRALSAARASDSPSAAQRVELEAALRECALHGSAGAFAPPTSPEGLLSHADAVDAEMGRRLAAADLEDPGSALAALFGRAIPVLDEATPPKASRADLVASLGGKLASADEVQRWAGDAARVRAPLDQWRRLGLVATALGRPLGAPQPAQIPFAPGDRWAATTSPTGNRVALAVIGAEHLRAGTPICGFVLDEWQESVPAATAATSIAYHYDAPSAEAPQAMLVVVPPDATPRWSADILLAAVHQTLDLAAWRGVDGEGLRALAPILPLSSVAANRGQDTAGIAFENLLAGNEV